MVDVGLAPRETTPTVPTDWPVELDEVGRTLLRAAQVVRQRGWWRGPVGFGDHSPVCVIGAIRVAVTGNPGLTSPGISVGVVPAYIRLAASLDLEHSEGAVVSWNDKMAQGQGHVIEALERAAIGC